MEKSTLYNSLDSKLLQRWRDEAEKAETETWFFTREKEALKELEAQLNETGKELLTSYYLAVEDRLEYLHHILKIKFLNLGIQMGMDLQKAFAKFE